MLLVFWFGSHFGLFGSHFSKQKKEKKEKTAKKKKTTKEKKTEKNIAPTDLIVCTGLEPVASRWPTPFYGCPY